MHECSFDPQVLAIAELANASSPENFPWQGGPMSAEVQKMAKMKLRERATAQLELLESLSRCDKHTTYKMSTQKYTANTDRIRSTRIVIV